MIVLHSGVVFVDDRHMVSCMTMTSTNDLPLHWLEPLRTPHGILLPNRIVPGPMEGISVGPFCRVLSQRGWVRCWFTPFIRISTGIPRTTRLRRRIEPYLEMGLPVIAQVMGTDSMLLAEAAGALSEFGLAGVDLNCGCPSKGVINNGSGGERLTDPDWIYATLCGMRMAAPRAGISVKLRSGFESPEEMPAILAAVCSAEPDFVVFHFRTVSEAYGNVADGLARLARARELLPDMILIGSGDVFSTEDALRMYAVAAVDGVAPARGLMVNPRLLCEIEAACRGEESEPLSVGTQCAFLAELSRDTLRVGDTRRGLIVEIAARMFGRGSELFQQITAQEDLRELIETLGERVAGGACSQACGP